MRSFIPSRVLAAALLCLLTSTAVHAQTSPTPAPAKPAAASPPAFNGVVNINTASADELALLPGVGPARAKAIVDYRTAQGPFKKVDDLAGVSGIGSRSLERLRPFIVTDGKTTARP